MGFLEEADDEEHSLEGVVKGTLQIQCPKGGKGWESQTHTRARGKGWPRKGLRGQVTWGFEGHAGV